MIKVTLEGRRQDDGSVPILEVEVPALPQIGSYVTHDVHPGISGWVRHIDFWWDEESRLTIKVRLRQSQ